MGRRKKTDPIIEKVVPVVEIEFVDGPRGGGKLRVGNPPKQFIRLAFPEWCTYQRVDKTLQFKYIGDVKLSYNWDGSEIMLG